MWCICVFKKYIWCSTTDKNSNLSEMYKYCLYQGLNPVTCWFVLLRSAEGCWSFWFGWIERRRLAKRHGWCSSFSFFFFLGINLAKGFSVDVSLRTTCAHYIGLSLVRAILHKRILGCPVGKLFIWDE